MCKYGTIDPNGDAFGWLRQQPEQPPTFLSIVNRLLLEVDRVDFDCRLDRKHPLVTAAAAVKDALLTGTAFKSEEYK